MSHDTNRNDLVMQNPSEEAGRFSNLTLCDTLYFADKNKLNSIPLP
jgi:hypothetical protein